MLNGPSAFAFGYEDATAPARELNSVIKKLDKMSFKAGIVEGEYYDQDGIMEIAKLPSREELIAKFMGSIKSPVSKLVYLLQGDRRSERGRCGNLLRQQKQLLPKKLRKLLRKKPQQLRKMRRHPKKQLLRRNSLLNRAGQPGQGCVR